MRIVKELRDEIATRPVYDPLQEADERLFLLEWATRRMLQALDANWWHRYEKYRKIVESCLAP